MEPPDATEDSSGGDFATDLEFYGISAIRETEALLARLHVPHDEHPYFGLAYDLSTAKRYLLSRSLMAVQYAAGAFFRLAEHIRRRDTLDQPRSEGLSHILTTSIITEQSTTRRRLAEVLATLVNFTSTISDQHFLCYLLLEERLKCRRESENDRHGANRSWVDVELRRAAESPHGPVKGQGYRRYPEPGVIQAMRSVGLVGLSGHLSLAGNRTSLPCVDIEGAASGDKIALLPPTVGRRNSIRGSAPHSYPWNIKSLARRSASTSIADRRTVTPVLA